MASRSVSGTVRHFSLANPSGEMQADVPELLRRVAGKIESLEPIQIRDVVYRPEVDAGGDDWPSMTVSFRPTVDDIQDLFAPFVRDAAVSAGVQFVVSHSGSDAGGIFVLVTAQDGSGDGFQFDRQGTPEDHLLQALESFDILQDTVQEFLWSATGRYGPWPPCPVAGHTHALGSGRQGETGRPWWICPDGVEVTPVGDLAAQ